MPKNRNKSSKKKALKNRNNKTRKFRGGNGNGLARLIRNPNNYISSAQKPFYYATLSPNNPYVSKKGKLNAPSALNRAERVQRAKNASFKKTSNW